MFRVYSSDQYTVPLPEKHRFPMSKYQLLRDTLIKQNLVQPDQIHVPPAATVAQLCLVHHESYVNKVLSGQLNEQEIRRLGFPWSTQLMERAKRSVGGTLAAAHSALEDGISGNLAGGTHHAHADFGSGYCTFNDVAVSILYLQQKQKIKRALVIDLDVHQGDGTAVIFENDPTVFTFSMHGEHNFPFRKAQSDLDVSLSNGVADSVYLDRLNQFLPQVIEQAKPEIVFYLAGADPLHSDRLGKLNLSLQGLKDRDRRVISTCFSEKIPIVCVLSGGYAVPLEDTIQAHCNTYLVINALLATETQHPQ